MDQVLRLKKYKELKNISSRFTIYNLDDIYSENYFKDKKIIEIHR